MTKLCFALILLGRPLHSLAALYLADFIRKFQLGGLGEGKTLFSSEIVFVSYIFENVLVYFLGQYREKKCTSRLTSL